jgi:FixJ family two-component response regulator
LQPDGVILDLDVPVGGIRLRKWIQEWRAELPVIFYTRHADHPSRMKEMLAIGAAYEDIISKGEESEKDISSIEQRFQQLWRKTGRGNPWRK